jgi:general stress protein 26
MTSRDDNGHDHHRENLQGPEAIEQIEQIVKEAKTCFFCTRGGEGTSSGVRPMSVRDVDDLGNLWFLSADDSHKNLEIASDPNVELFFQGSAHSAFLHLVGHAEAIRDRGRIEKLWTPLARAWFTEGADDPRLTAIRFAPSGGYYWDDKYGDAITGAAIVIGAVLGKPLEASVHGRVRP